MVKHSYHSCNTLLKIYAIDKWMLSPSWTSAFKPTCNLVGNLVNLSNAIDDPINVIKMSIYMLLQYYYYNNDSSLIYIFSFDLLYNVLDVGYLTT